MALSPRLCCRYPPPSLALLGRKDCFVDKNGISINNCGVWSIRELNVLWRMNSWETLFLCLGSGYISRSCSSTAWLCIYWKSPGIVCLHSTSVKQTSNHDQKSSLLFIAQTREMLSGWNDPAGPSNKPQVTCLPCLTEEWTPLYSSISILDLNWR